ncbi:MAG: hypothetical protein WDN46_24930 [Methylocella sp.]
MKWIKYPALLAAMLATAACVSPGGGGTEANFIDPSTGSLSERRAALKAVDVVDSAPAGARDLGGVSARRCHRYFTEAEPSASSLIPDLQIAAYGQGADVIRLLGVEKKTGLLADCWYVLEGHAEIYSLPKPQAELK